MAIAPLFEAFAFTAVVLIDIWFLHSRTWWGDALVGVFALVSFAAHRESLGVGIRELVTALRAWRVVLLISAAAVVVGLLFASHPLDLLYRGVVYFAWCVLQQLLLQNMIYRRVRSALGPTGKAALLSGVLFAAAHLPNPVLAPATLVWGTVSTRLFERRQSIIAIALLQTLLSSLLIWVTPVAWHHQFRVGPGYWRTAPYGHGSESTFEARH
jgi:hypothetical protein